MARIVEVSGPIGPVNPEGRKPTKRQMEEVMSQVMEQEHSDKRVEKVTETSETVTEQPSAEVAGGKVTVQDGEDSEDKDDK